MSDDKKPAVPAVTALLLGMGSILDLGGTMRHPLREEPLSPEEAARADTEAMASFWEAVGTAAMASAWEAVGSSFRTVLGEQPRKAPSGVRKGRRGRLRRR